VNGKNLAKATDRDFHSWQDRDGNLPVQQELEKLEKEIKNLSFSWAGR